MDFLKKIMLLNVAMPRNEKKDMHYEIPFSKHGLS